MLRKKEFLTFIHKVEEPFQYLSQCGRYHVTCNGNEAKYVNTFALMVIDGVLCQNRVVDDMAAVEDLKRKRKAKKEKNPKHIQTGGRYGNLYAAPST